MIALHNWERRAIATPFQCLCLASYSPHSQPHGTVAFDNLFSDCRGRFAYIHGLGSRHPVYATGSALPHCSAVALCACCVEELVEIKRDCFHVCVRTRVRVDARVHARFDCLKSMTASWPASRLDDLSRS